MSYDRLVSQLNNSEDTDPAMIPDYQTVELLKKIRERDDIDEETKDEFHRLAFAGNTEETALRKEIRERMRTVEPEDIDRANYNRRREIDSLLRLARNSAGKGC